MLNSEDAIGTDAPMERGQPKPFVFVVMPFSSEFDDVYNLAIKQACDDVGAYCERVDEQMFSDSILARVYNQIAKADVIVAELTSPNPNVYYETGYAHALQKHVVLVTKDASQIPFDLAHYPHVVYGSSLTTLKSGLEARLRWAIENAEGRSPHSQLPIEAYINGQRLLSGSVTDIGEMPKERQYMEDADKCRVFVKLDLHNPTPKTVRSDGAVGLITSRRFTECTGRTGVPLPNSDQMLFIEAGTPLTFLPLGWIWVGFYLEGPGLAYEPPQEEVLTFRVFSEFGPEDFAVRAVV
jgi:hypothetical protein